MNSPATPAAAADTRSSEPGPDSKPARKKAFWPLKPNVDVPPPAKGNGVVAKQLISALSPIVDEVWEQEYGRGDGPSTRAAR